MKLPKLLSRTRKSSIPALKFQKQDLSSYSGLVVFQKLFADFGLSSRLSKGAPRGGQRGARELFAGSSVISVESKGRFGS